MVIDREKIEALLAEAKAITNDWSVSAHQHLAAARDAAILGALLAIDAEIMRAARAAQMSPAQPNAE